MGMKRRLLGSSEVGRSKKRTNINADDALKAVFGGKKTVTMFEMTKLVSKHLK